MADACGGEDYNRWDADARRVMERLRAETTQEWNRTQGYIPWDSPVRVSSALPAAVFASNHRPTKADVQNSALCGLLISGVSSLLDPELWQEAYRNYQEQGLGVAVKVFIGKLGISLGSGALSSSIGLLVSYIEETLKKSCVCTASNFSINLTNVCLAGMGGALFSVVWETIHAGYLYWVEHYKNCSAEEKTIANTARGQILTWDNLLIHLTSIVVSMAVAVPLGSTFAAALCAAGIAFIATKIVEHLIRKKNEAGGWKEWSRPFFAALGLMSHERPTGWRVAPNEVRIPPDLVCPILHELFTEPVLTPYGHIFERTALSQALAIAPRCPLTRQPLTITQCRRCREMETVVAGFAAANGFVRNLI